MNGREVPNRAVSTNPPATVANGPQRLAVRTEDGIEDLLRRLTPQALGALVRRYGHFDACEDAVQEAMIAATDRWPRDGLPERPLGWLVTVASRRLTDQLRSEASRRRREDTTFAASMPMSVPPSLAEIPGDDVSGTAPEDEMLTLLFLCCHPALSGASQLALTLRAVGGLTTAQIASAFLVPESTMAQRISRAKQTIRSSSIGFAEPSLDDRHERLQVVLHVLYLIFNEGYTATSGTALLRTELTAEAIRLTRSVYAVLADHGEVAGLLALMLLTDARRPSRTQDDGALIPLAKQDRSRWDRRAIAEGVALITNALATARLGPYQLQAAIAAVHSEAPTSDATDWPQIVALYGLLGGLAPNPMVTLNQAVAVAMVDGPSAGLAMLEPLDSDERMVRHHRLHAVRAYLLEMSGDLDGARAGYRTASRLTTSIPEKRYLEARAKRLAEPEPLN